MADEQGADGPASRPSRGLRAPLRTGRGRKILGWTAVVVVAMLVAGALTAYLKVRSVYDSIGHVAVTDLGKRPPRYTSAMNILVFGSDTRAGLTPHQQYVLHVGSNQGENNTDTIMVLHISPGRGKATVLSLPRDLMVPTYACPAGQGHPGQQADPAAQVQINSLYQTGGPSCLWKSVEQLTGVRIDHFIKLNFGGFVKAVNDLGGVNVCLPFTVNDANSGLRLGKGPHHIDGLTALEFWRTRYAIGNGSDLQRIQRDQYLLAQVLQGGLHKGLLSSPLRLVSVVRDLAGAMTTDSQMSQSDLLHLASSLNHIHSSDVQFVTVPNTQDPVQPSQVVLQQPQARHLFKAIAHDTTLPRTGGSSPAASAPSLLTVRPSKVSVTVLNGSGRPGLASEAATALASRGFHVLGTGDATTASGAVDYSYTTSVIEYPGPSQRAAADTLRHQLGSVTLRQDSSLTPGTVSLILGTSFSSLVPRGGAAGVAVAPQPAGSPGPQPASSASPSVSGLAKSYGGISGSVSCSGDQAAFQGPNSP